ncbi:MAG: hypothetical protein MJZ24_03570 [Paludibacteraceae bacterium]|nr:hypothetical protein [Paludibacteraceae bacterium]
MRKTTNLFAKLGVCVMLSSAMMQSAQAQLGYGISALSQGVKAAKNSKNNKKYEPLKEKALEAIQKNDIEYLMSEECMIQLTEMGEKLSGKNAQDWKLTKAKINTYFYVLCHTLEQNNFVANIDELMDKASKTSSEKEKALYVDAAIAVMKGMIVYNYDVNANLATVNATYNKVKAMYDQLPASYKPVTVPKGADPRDIRFLHNLTGGVPDAQDMLEIQAQLAQQKKANEEAKAKAEAENAQKEAQDIERRKKMFYSNLADYSMVNIKRYRKNQYGQDFKDDYNVMSASGSRIYYGVGFRELNGLVFDQYVTDKRSKQLVNFSRRSYGSEDKDYIEYNGAFSAYITPELKVYKGTSGNRSQSDYMGYMDSKGNCYDKNGRKIGYVDTYTINRGSYSWRCNTSSDITKINSAIVLIFFGEQLGGDFTLKSE